MTNAEAIEILKSRRMCAAYVDSEYVDSVDIEAIDMAISALEKQEGKKPNNRSGWPGGGRDTADGNCPVCGSPLVCTTPRYYSKHEYYCRDCGQKILWE